MTLSWSDRDVLSWLCFFSEGKRERQRYTHRHSKSALSSFLDSHNSTQMRAITTMIPEKHPPSLSSCSLAITPPTTCSGLAEPDGLEHSKALRAIAHLFGRDVEDAAVQLHRGQGWVCHEHVQSAEEHALAVEDFHGTPQDGGTTHICALLRVLAERSQRGRKQGQQDIVRPEPQAGGRKRQ